MARSANRWGVPERVRLTFHALAQSPTASRTGRTSALHCEWATRDGTTRIYDLKVTTKRNDPTLSQLEGLSAESQRIMLSAMLPAYLGTQLEFGPLPEAAPPQGFTLRKVTHGGYPAPGPGGMLGWCTSVGYRATSGAETISALGLACVVVAANHRDLLQVGSVLGARHKSGSNPPTGFAREAERISGSLRHRK